MIKSESLKALAPALVKAQQKMGAALKDSKNPFFKSSYADLGAVIDATVPVFNAEGIAVLQTPMTAFNGKAVIQTILLHESGEYLASETDIVSAKQNDPQAYGSAISYARRYGLQSTATIKTTDDDGEAAMDRFPKKESSATESRKQSEPQLTVAVTAAPAKKYSFSKKAAPTTVITKTEVDKMNIGDDI